MAEQKKSRADIVIGHTQRPPAVVVAFNELKGLFSSQTARDLAALLIRQAEIVEALSGQGGAFVGSETLSLDDPRVGEIAKAHGMAVPDRS